MMKRMVLKLPAAGDPRTRQKALKCIAGMQGVIHVSVDVREALITVFGEADPVAVTNKLKKFGRTDLLSVVPVANCEKQKPKQQQRDDLAYVKYAVYQQQPPLYSSVREPVI